MKIEKVNPDIKYLYHYTLKKNVEKILKDKAIISKDQYVFFTESLKDSNLAFEREMMQENKLYIDVNGVLRKREKCNKEDYCILKIPYINDGQFYKFKFDNQSKESIYTISITHKGAYKFKNAKVIEFSKNKKMNKIKQTAVAAVATGILLFPYNTFAANWLDTNNYDITWYTEGLSSGEYKIETEKEIAGLAHLVNNEGITFEGKEIEIKGNIDLRENTWQTISDIFKGTICGSHRIILNLLDGKLIKNININNVGYSINAWVDGELKRVEVEAPYTVGALKNATINGQIAFLNSQPLTDDSKSLFDLNLKKEDTLELVSGMPIFIENSKGEKVILNVESGASIDNVKQKYLERTGIKNDKIVLMFKGKELEYERTLADYNIQKESILQVYIKVDVNTNVNEGKGNIKITQDTSTSSEPEEITITLEPEEGYEIETIIINGINKTNEVKNNKLIIKSNYEDVDVKVTYKLKENKEENKDTIKDTTTEDKLEEEKNNIVNETSTNNPKTGDNIATYIATFIASLIGLIITRIKSKKEK